MSLYIGKENRSYPLLHITKGTHSISTMKGPPISNSILHTDRRYQVLEYVKSVPMSIETLDSYGGWWQYGVYNLGINILESSYVYIGVGRDLYTNSPILYTQNVSVFTYSGYWAWDYDQETQRGGYGFVGMYGGGYYDNSFDGVCKYAFALGSKAPGNYTYVPPNFTPSLDLYRIKSLDLSTTSSIKVTSEGVFFDSTNILKSNLIGVGPLMNDYVISDSISSATSLLQLLNHSSDSVSLESDKIYITRGGTKVELVGTSTSYLLSSNILYTAPSKVSTFSFSIPTNGFVQLRYLVQVEPPETFARYIVSMITTIDIDTPSVSLRTFGILISDDNAYTKTVGLLFIKNGNVGTIRLVSLEDGSSGDPIDNGYIFITSLRANTLSL